MRWSNDARHLSRLFLCVLVGLMLGWSGQVAAAGTDTHDPCGFVTEDEAATVLGEALAVPPFRDNGGQPDANGDTCRYETAAFRSITVAVDWSDRGTKMKLLGVIAAAADASPVGQVLVLSNGVTVQGAWDQAKDFLCCEFNATSGERLVVVDISASRASIEQAAALADMAIKRLDKPLTTDGAAGIDAAMSLDHRRPTVVAACNLIARSEAEAVLGGPLDAEPSGDQSSCHFAWTAKDAGYSQQLDLEVTWRGGLAELRQTQAAIGQAEAFMGTDETPDAEVKDATFDEHAESIIGVMAVRHDVLLSFETGGMNNDVASAFLAIAAKKL